MDSDTNISFIAIDHLSPNPLQPRGTITSDSVQDLVESIQEHGIMLPLVAAETPAGLQIIAGERRWRAAKLAGLTEVPVTVIKTTPRGMLEMAIVENVQRSDLNPLERAKAFDRLLNEFGLNTNDVSKRVGKSAAYVSNSIRLLSLPDALKDGLLSGLISEGHARALSAIDDVGLLIEAYKIILRESGSVRRAEELARRMKDKGGQVAKQMIKERAPLIVSQQIDDMHEELLKKLNQNSDGHKNSVKLSRSRNETKILISLKGNIENTEPRLQMIYQAIMNAS